MSEFTLVGLNAFQEAVNAMCALSEVYRRCGPPAIALDLPPGHGQSAAARYLLQKIEESHMISFSGPEHLREYRLTGSQDQMIQCFLDLQACAATTNYFQGVTVWDLRALAQQPDDTPALAFPQELLDKGRSSCSLLFLPDLNGRFAAKVRQILPELISVHAKPYSPRQLAQIALLQLKELQIELKDEEELELLMLRLVCHAKATAPRDLRPLVRSAMQGCRCVDSRLLLTVERLADQVGLLLEKGV